MSTPEPPSGPPAEAGVTPEPGHRARALAASLLGELTGQRRSGLTFAPLEATGLSSVPSADPAGPGQPAETSPADPSSPDAAEAQDAVVPQDAAVRVETVPAASTTQDAPAAVEPTPTPAAAVEPTPTSTAADEPTPTSSAADATPRLEPDDVSRPAEQQGSGPLRTAPAPVAPTGPALRAVPDPADRPAAPVQPVAASSGAASDAAAAAPVAAPPVAPTAHAAPTPAAGTAMPPTVSAALTPSAPPSSTAPVPQGGQGGPAASKDVRPAPFAYLAVSQHHTTPARATANGALDQAGQRISSRVDRALVRRAAQVSMEATSLLDACDVLDGRARAADATWTGDHHSATEVREFEGAWGAFYDAQGALAQHVTS